MNQWYLTIHRSNGRIETRGPYRTKALAEGWGASLINPRDTYEVTQTPKPTTQ